MSLETGSFIKDLVANNPAGGDPKSQGDDHLRLVKAVLKSQFSGFTEGVPITRTEGQLNSIPIPAEGGLGGLLSAAPIGNIDTVVQKTRLFGVAAGTLGTLPPVTNTGDIVLNQAYDATHIHQHYFDTVNSNEWVRRWNGTAWSAWQPLYADSGPIIPTFANNYTDLNSVHYRKIGRLVTISGTIGNNGVPVPGSLMFTLPVGYRPLGIIGSTMYWKQDNSVVNLLQLTVESNGQVKVQNNLLLNGATAAPGFGVLGFAFFA